jgi:hypothetical protein
MENTTMIDLWPDGIEETRVRSPVTILREQGSLLGQKTKNLVQGEVFESALNDKNFFSFSFFLVAPALSNYRYKLLTIYHDIGLYPVEIAVEDQIMLGIDSRFKYTGKDVSNGSMKVYLKSASEEDFLELLRAVFRSEKTIRVITSLLSQSDPNYQPQNGESSAISLR